MCEMRILDPNICKSFRDAINNSPVISNEEQTDLYNLSCAVMDRLDTAVNYLNKNWSFPNTEEDFLCFIMFACMLNDGVDNIYKRTIGTVPPCNLNKNHFKSFCMSKPLELNEEDCLTDEQFFEYFRSISFAHPYGTDHNATMRNLMGWQVSPWVVVNKSIQSFYKFQDAIGVRIYGSKKDDSENDLYDIMFSFSALKNFLVDKYSSLIEVIEWVKEQSEKQYEEWKKDKINRNQMPGDVLREICNILSKRRESIYEIEDMITNLEIPLSDGRNKKCVSEYREYLIGIIPQLCDCIENLNDAGEYEQERRTRVFCPLGLHQMAHYQLEKIFSYLNKRSVVASSGSNEEWGLKMADAFYNEFAKKWVVMDVYRMDYSEIKLLVLTSLFMECKAQKRLDIR